MYIADHDLLTKHTVDVAGSKTFQSSTHRECSSSRLFILPEPLRLTPRKAYSDGQLYHVASIDCTRITSDRYFHTCFHRRQRICRLHILTFPSLKGRWMASLRRIIAMDVELCRNRYDAETYKQTDRNMVRSPGRQAHVGTRRIRKIYADTRIIYRAYIGLHIITHRLNLHI